MERIDEFIRKAKTLPPAPKVLPELMSLLQQSDVDNDKVVRLVTFDPALTMKILQVCNSAAFAGSDSVADLNEAVMRIGFGEVFRILAAILSEQALSGTQAGYGLEQGELWDHSAITAIAAQTIARDRGLDQNLAFTAGLLHDIGKIVLATALEGAYSKLVEETEAKGHSLLEAEKLVLGADHAEVGGRLLEQWKFPAPLVASVTWHHDPIKANTHQPMAACVYLANLIAGFTGHSYGYQAFAVKGRDEVMDILGLKADAVPLLMIKTLDEAKRANILAVA
jgi:putative nucleotidyltransferase with HDIG domain